MSKGVLCKCSNDDCFLSSNEANPLVCYTKIESSMIPNNQERIEVRFPLEPLLEKYSPYAGETFVYPSIRAVCREIDTTRQNLTRNTKDGPYAPSRGKIKGFVFERLGRPAYPPLVWLTFPCPNCQCKLLPKEIPPHCDEDEYTLLNFYAWFRQSS